MAHAKKRLSSDPRAVLSERIVVIDQADQGGEAEGIAFVSFISPTCSDWERLVFEQELKAESRSTIFQSSVFLAASHRVRTTRLSGVRVWCKQSRHKPNLLWDHSTAALTVRPSPFHNYQLPFFSSVTLTFRFTTSTS